MSDPVGFHKHARRLLDRAIHRGFAALRSDAAATRAYASLLDAAWGRSTLLRTERGRCRAPAAEAIANLARHHRDHVRPALTWAGGDGSIHELVRSLALHTLAVYQVPPVLSSVWFGDDSPAARAERRWYVEHARGCSIRAIDGLPMAMTRRMERTFLTSPPHLPVRAALRRAEILALGGQPALVDSILATDLAADLSHGEFWRTVMHFLVNHWSELRPTDVPPLIDFLYAVRIRPLEIATADGVVLQPPPEPDFSIAGRSPRSLARMVADWHGDLARMRDTGRTWPRSGLKGLVVREEPAGERTDTVQWSLVELLHSTALLAEGRALQHCVATYETLCVYRHSSIWSLRRQVGDAPARPLYTVEVNPRTRAIVQIRGHRNRPATGQPLRIVSMWAAAERLSMGNQA